MKILITGATGFVGRELLKALTQGPEVKENHELVILTRNVESAREKVKHLGSRVQIFPWNSTQELPPSESLEKVDVIVNLAGEPVFGKRWSPQQKKKIYESRIFTTRNLMDGIKKIQGQKPSVIVSASAIGFYGDRTDEILNEGSSQGGGFLAEVCKDWEKEVLDHPIQGMRSVVLRIGLVLGKDEGVMKQMLPLFSKGLGGRLGSGKQWMSWIHCEDLVSLILKAIQDPGICGALNGTSPHPVTNTEFTRTLSQVLRKPAFLPAPILLLKLTLGEVSEILITGQKVLPQKALDHGFVFKYPELKGALGSFFHS